MDKRICLQKREDVEAKPEVNLEATNYEIEASDYAMEEMRRCKRKKRRRLSERHRSRLSEWSLIYCLTVA